MSLPPNDETGPLPNRAVFLNDPADSRAGEPPVDLNEPMPYILSPHVRRQIMEAFTYHAPRAETSQSFRYEDLRTEARDLAMRIAVMTPPSREQALALTKLEEAIMWANAAIARNE